MLVNRIKLFSPLVFLFIFIAIIQSPTYADGNALGLTDEMSCRYGVSTTAAHYSGNNDGWDRKWLRMLGSGWFLSFSASADPIESSEYYRMINVHQDRDEEGNWLPSWHFSGSENGLRAKVRRSPPGSIWLIGNEPDTDRQDGIHPHLYAEAFHDVSEIIRDEDPSALIANAGLVSASRNRMHYLSMVWDAYLAKYGEEMPVDIWNIHLYVLAEADAEGNPIDGRAGAIGTNGLDAAWATSWDIEDCLDPHDQRYCYREHDDIEVFKGQVYNMREWMAEHGQRDKPLIITEYSVLFPYIETDEGCQIWDENKECFGPDRVVQFMHNTLDFFENHSDPTLGHPHDGNRLVQQWLWFTTYSPGVGAGSSLLRPNAKNINPATAKLEDILTPVGMAYMERASQNLQPDLALVSTSQPVHNNNGTVKLTARIVNNGNVNIDEPFTVTYYGNAERTDVIGAITIEEPIRGCGRQLYDVELEQTARSGGTFRYWVEVDSANEIVEQDEADNVVEEVIIVEPNQIYIPAAFRPAPVTQTTAP